MHGIAFDVNKTHSIHRQYWKDELKSQPRPGTGVRPMLIRARSAARRTSAHKLIPDQDDDDSYDDDDDDVRPQTASGRPGLRAVV